jgi:surface antigen
MITRTRNAALIATIGMTLGLGACAGYQGGPKEGVGTLLGAGTGALIGSQIGDGRGQLVATSVGTLVGGYIGNQAGKSLDRADAVYAGRAQLQSLEYAPTGRETAWRNPDNGHYGSVTPTYTYQQESGGYCRDYTHEVYMDGRVEYVDGTACRRDDGRWEAVR